MELDKKKTSNFQNAHKMNRLGTDKKQSASVHNNSCHKVKPFREKSTKRSFIRKINLRFSCGKQNLKIVLSVGHVIFKQIQINKFEQTQNLDVTLTSTRILVSK